MTLASQQLEDYERDGFLYGIKVVSETEALRFRNLYDEFEAREGRKSLRSEGQIDRHLDQKFVWDIATNPKTLDCMEAILGPNILVLWTRFFVKYPGEKGEVGWHQDVRFWGLQPPEAQARVWYAIDDSDSENGCMRIIPGTHRLGFLKHMKSEDSGYEWIAVSPDDERLAVDCILKSGEISIHHGLVTHCSRLNPSTRRRCGLTISYIPTWVKPAPSKEVYRGDPSKYSWQNRPILVRGVDREKNFGERPRSFPETH